MLAPEVIESAGRSVLCWLATVDASGQPNVSPKEVFAALDDTTLVIANIASPTSVRNVGMNERVCVSFVDVFVQKGFKLLGAARNVGKNSAEYLTLVRPLEELVGPRFPIHSVLAVKVDAVEAIVAPSYRLFPESTTEQSQILSAMRTYGVGPVSGGA